MCKVASKAASKAASKEPSLTLSKAFKTGLMEKYKMTLEELKDYEYCGGDMGRHYRYWILRYPNTPPPSKEFECVCYHRIVENCYITNGTELLVIGNCCIQKFVTKCTRTCERCGEPHRNRTINRCNVCRDIGFCKKCKKKIDEKYTLCYTCKYPYICVVCGWSCKKGHNYCNECENICLLYL